MADKPARLHLRSQLLGWTYVGVEDPGVRARGRGGILLAADKSARSRLGMAILGWAYVGLGAWRLVRPGANWPSLDA